MKNGVRGYRLASGASRTAVPVSATVPVTTCEVDARDNDGGGVGPALLNVGLGPDDCTWGGGHRAVSSREGG